MFLKGFGGDVSNFAFAAARQGSKITNLCAVGDDFFGKEFIDLWEKDNIDNHFLPIGVSGGHTGMYFISYDENGHHFSYMRKGSAASRMTPEHLTKEMFENVGYFHFSAITQAISETACDATFRAIELAHKAGGLASYDTNLRLKLWPLPRAKAIIKETMTKVDLVFTSIEEAEVFTGKSDANEVMDTLISWGISKFVLKLGPEGAIYRDKDTQVQVEGYVVEAVDATGAGDTFAGAFVSELMATNDPEKALRYANAAAAISVTGYGAVQPIPTRNEVEAFIASR
jgi:2-dehydro-3-deoxygluconokinase